MAWTPRASPWRGDDLVSTSTATGTLEQILKHEQSQFKAKVSPAPLLSITRYTGESPYLGVTVGHELADGLGSLRLVHAILGAEVFEPEGVPPRLEDILDIRPSFATMVGVVLRKILLPKLPTFISSYFPPERVWPGAVPPPMTCKDNLSLLSLSPTLIGDLTRARDQHAPNATIHAVIQTAWTLALAGDSPMVFTAATPRSERQASPNCLGNYVSSLSFRFTPAHRQKPFWALATEVSEHLKSNAALRSGREAVGMLAHVPTDWEGFWRDQAGGEMPYSDSWELSNLGRTDLPQGATDMAWAQPGTIVGAAINVSMLRHAGGLRLCVTWRSIDQSVIEQAKVAFLRQLSSI